MAIVAATTVAFLTVMVGVRPGLPFRSAPPADLVQPAPTTGVLASAPGTGPRGMTMQMSRTLPGQSYYLYVPNGYDPSQRYRLLVVVHGFERHAQEYAGQFTEFADEARYVVLAPYIPTGERFQQLGIAERDRTPRYDERLLTLVSEVGGQLNVETDHFDLFGFSAGAQFAHRFLYLHPERLRSVVVASPGTVTVPTDRYDWPSGLGDLDDFARVRVNLDRVRQVRVMLVVGDQDVTDGNLNDSDEARRFGKTRLARVRTLHQAWEETHIAHRYLEVDGLAHLLDQRIVGPASRFLAEG